MTRFASYIAKITPPSQEGIVPRPRLFADLDAGRERQVVWVSASAGAGKTALVGSYLDHLDSSRQCIWYKMDAGDADPASFFFCLGLAFQQHLSLAPGSFPVLSPDQTQNRAIFGIHFFEHVFTLPGAPKLVVIDNYHEVPDDAAIHNLLANALANLPADTSFILISRDVPPPAFARLRVSKHLTVLNADSLRFNLQETEQVVNRVIPGFPYDLTERVYKHTGGWAAGLVLMVEHQRLIGAGGTGSPVNTPQEIMDYLAAELFQQATPLHQDFLLRSSAFDGMTAGMAKELTGVENVSEILASLSRKHFFSDLHLNDDPLYLYPPLFLEFLRRQAASRFGHAAFRDIVRCAAVITEQQGFLEQAVSLYIASHDWPGVALMFQTISSDMISQGRTTQLIEWLEKVPGAELNHHPRLLYWLGIAELSLARCTGARAYLELALMALDKQSDAEGVYLSWAAVVESFFLEMSELQQLDEWISSLQRIEERYPVIPRSARLAVALSNFTAHVLRQSERDVVRLSRERLDAVLEEKDASHVLRATLVASLHHIWSGAYHQNELLLTELRQKVDAATSPPLTTVTLKMLEATHFWLTADSGRCRDAVDEGMALAEETGLKLWDNQYLSCHVHAAIIEGDLAQARVYLQRMKLNLTGASSLNGFYYHLLSAWVDLLEDDSASAQGHLEAAEGPMMSVGSRYYEGIWCLAMAEVKLRRKANEAALHLTEKALSIGSKHDIKNLLFLSLLYRAQMLVDAGRSREGLDSLKSGMRLGREQNYVHFIWWIPRKIAALCALSLQHGIEVEYARMLIRRRGLFPELPPVEVEQWPWDVSIYCLGKLEVRVRNVPVKIQKKPLELLKAIIALGGSDVRQERVTDLLWPDADGDTAFGSFKITLYRLRRLLGENSLHFKEGKVSLDPKCVWHDVAAFERLALKASAQREDRDDPQMAVKLAEQAIAHYKGQFLMDDQEQGWFYQQREKLSRTFVTLVTLLGERQIAAGEWEQAIATFRKGVEMEPLAEPLNEGIIRAYCAAGYRGEAVQSYKNYEHALLENLGIPPAPRINQLVAAP